MFDKRSLAKGKRGENKVAAFLINNGFDLRDVSNEKEYQCKDIDFIATKGANSFTVEVKSSNAREGKIVVEDILNIRKGKLGWIHYCEADFIMVAKADKIITYKPSEMRDFLSKANKHFKDIMTGTEIDLSLTTERRMVEDPIIKNSTSLVHYVDCGKYAKLGYYIKIVDKI